MDEIISNFVLLTQWTKLYIKLSLTGNSLLICIWNELNNEMSMKTINYEDYYKLIQILVQFSNNLLNPFVIFAIIGFGEEGDK